MSEQVAAATPASTEVAPAPQPAEVAAPAPVERSVPIPVTESLTPVTPQTPQEARRAAKQIIQDRRSGQVAADASTPPAGEVQIDALGDAHGPDGKYVPKPAEVSTTEVVTPPEMVPSGEGEQATVEGEASDSETVTIPVPQGHPLWDRQKEFTVLKSNERDFRALLNSGARKAEVAQARQALNDARREAAAAKAESKFWQENSGEVFGPEFFGLYNDILENYGEERANAYRDGERAKAQGRITAEQQQAEEEHLGRQEFERAERFRKTAVKDALFGLGTEGPSFEHWPEDGKYGYLSAFKAYAVKLQADGSEARLSREDWLDVARYHYDRTPPGLARIEREKEASHERIRAQMSAEAKRAEEERLQDAATRHSTNPMGNIPPVRTDARTMGGQPAIDLKNLTPKQARQAAKAAAREAYNR